MQKQKPYAQKFTIKSKLTGEISWRIYQKV